MIVSPVTITGSVTTAAAYPVEKTDAQGNIISVTSTPSIAKITNKTILDRMVADGLISSISGYSVAYINGSLGAYKKATTTTSWDFVLSAYYVLTYNYGDVGLGTDTETWRYGKDGAETAHSLTSKGVKGSGIKIGTAFDLTGVAKYSYTEKVTKITPEDLFSWISEVWVGRFFGLSGDSTQAFEGAVQAGTPVLVLP